MKADRRFAEPLSVNDDKKGCFFASLLHKGYIWKFFYFWYYLNLFTLFFSICVIMIHIVLFFHSLKEIFD